MKQQTRDLMYAPLISVMIPTYNSEKYIKEAVDSVIAQDYRPLEVIVVDDGSTDNTEAIIRQYDPALVHYYNQGRRGQPAARNYCCKKASGQFLAWLDSDDYYLPGKLTAQMRYLDEHPECEIVFTLHKNFYDDEESASVIEKHPLGKKMFTKTTRHHTTMLARRAMLERVGWRNESLKVHDDVDWINRITLVYKVDISHVINEVYLLRRLHKDSNLFQKSSLESISTVMRLRAGYLRENIKLQTAKHRG